MSLRIIGSARILGFFILLLLCGQGISAMELVGNENITLNADVPRISIVGESSEKYPDTLLQEESLQMTEAEPMTMSTSSIDFYRGVHDLADALGTASNVYEWVHSNVDFVPHWGMHKGESRTLLTRSGGDICQASLMIRLLRYLGYTAKYKRGSVTLSYDDVVNWVGAANHEEAKLAFINGGYQPGHTIWWDGTQQTISLEHVWVYIDDPGNEGGDYFPAIKSYANTGPKNIEELINFDFLAFTNALGGINTSDYSGGHNYNALDDYLCVLTTNLIDSLSETYPNSGPEILFGERVINPLYTPSFTYSWYEDLDEIWSFDQRYRHKIVILYETGGTIFEHSEAIDIIDTDYLHLQVTKQGAMSIANSSGLYGINDLGRLSSYDISMYYKTATGISANDYENGPTNTYTIQKEGAYVIALGDETSDNNAELDYKRARLSGVMADESSTDEDKLLETLALTGEVFMHENAALQRLLGSMDGHRWNTRCRFGLVGQEGGYFTDIKNNEVYTYRSEESADTNLNAFAAAMMFLSGFEHAALEQSQGADKPGISTVKILKLANDSSIPIYRLDSNNYSYASTNLSGYSSGEMSNFSSAVANGAVIVLPQSTSISTNDWSGSGYFERYDDGNGGQAMWAFIDGGYNGGYGSEEGLIDFWKLYSKEVANAMDEANKENKEFGEPVDMTTGAYVLDHDDLVMDGPLSLRLSRHYTSKSRNNLKAMGNGWVHSYEITANRHSAYDAGLGLRTPEDAASIVVAATVMKDLLQNADTPQGWLAATLTANWAMEQLVDNAVSVNVGRKVITFVEQPDGSFTPPPGMTVSLTETNNAYTMQERHGNTYEFSTNGLIDIVTDPYGNTLSFDYAGGASLNWVESSFGPRFTFSYTGSLLTSVADNSGRSVFYQYDASNNLTNFVDAAGKDWGITYDGDHKIKSLVDPKGITTIQNFYNDAGQVTNQISPTGKLWNYYFTGTRNVGEDPLGNQTAYYIDNQNRTWSEEQADGSRTYSFFDGQGHITNTVNAAGVTNIFVYDTDHNLLAQTNAVGLVEEIVTAYGYDDQHHLRFVTNAVGTTEQIVTEFEYYDDHALEYSIAAKGSGEDVRTDYSYNSEGLLEELSEGNGQRVTTFGYGSYNQHYGNPYTIESTDAGSATNSYSIRGDLESVIVDGKKTAYGYDANRRLVAITNAVDSIDQVVTSKTYYDNGLLKTSTDANSETIRFYWTPAYKQAGVVFPNTGSITNLYDDADRLVMSRDAEGNWATNTLDAVGRSVSVSSVYSVVTNQFDAVGNLVTNIVDPAGLGLESRFVYDDLNRMTNSYRPIGHDEYQMDALGRVTNRVNSASKNWGTEFDELGRVKKTFRPSGASEELNYDDLGYRTEFRNAEGKPIYFGVDAQGRATSVTNAIEKVTSFEFDDAGNLVSRRDAGGAETEYGYDGLNRLVAVTNESVEVTTFDHDANGNIVEHASPLASCSFGYNEMNLLTASTQSVYSVSSVVQNSYDLNGNRTNIVYPGGLSVSYNYGADNRLESVTTKYTNNTKTISFGYDTANRMTGLSYPNGVNSTFGLDAEGRVTNIVHGSFVDRTIQRNALGFKKTELIDAGIKPTAPEIARRIKTHNDADQLVSEQVQTDGTNWTTVTYSYSANGCLTNNSETGQSLTYDYENRIKSVDDVEYLYDASGARVGRVDGAATNYFVVDYTDGLKRPLAETDVTGDVTRFYVWSGSQLLCHIEANGDVYYYHADELGSTLAITDDNGDVTDQFAYMPYGYATHTGTANSVETPFQWLGGYGVYYDSGTDLHLTLHRVYSSKTKRFLQADPLGIDGGANVYAWANRNPLWFVDPYGLCAESTWSFSLLSVDAWILLAGGIDVGVMIDSTGQSAIYITFSGGTGVGAGIGNDAINYAFNGVSAFEPSEGTVFDQGGESDWYITGHAIVGGTAPAVGIPGEDVEFNIALEVGGGVFKDNTYIIPAPSEGPAAQPNPFPMGR